MQPKVSSIQPIATIAQNLGLSPDEWSPYGHQIAKIHTDRVLDRLADQQKGQLILMTAISPTPAGEGKTTLSIGLQQALHARGLRSLAVLREPSMGPVFGRKGGATGGGLAQLVPADQINLLFTGDLPAITAANNLLAALVDHHLSQGNPSGLDPKRINWRRCIDCNDRALRNCLIGVGGPENGTMRAESFQITAASEMMALFCLARDRRDLFERLRRIVVGWTTDNRPVRAEQIGSIGSLQAILENAFQPNLVQTGTGAPVLVHGGPFANVAAGCSSVTSLQLARHLADYVVTEAGFGADLGAEKFVDLLCQPNHWRPAATVLVITLRSLRYQGGVPVDGLDQPNLEAVRLGLPHLERHVSNLRKLHLEPILALNVYSSDSVEETNLLLKTAEKLGLPCVACSAYLEGAEGAQALADEIIKMLKTVPVDSPQNPREEKQIFNEDQQNYAYPLSASYEEKIERLCCQFYGAAKVNYTATARRKLRLIEGSGYTQLPICMAKTPHSFTDKAAILGCPSGFEVTVRDVTLAAGAGFVIVSLGTLSTLPGLPSVPAAERIQVDLETGNILGIN